MIIIQNKKSFLYINHVLFYNGETIEKNKLKKGIVFYHNCSEEVFSNLKKVERISNVRKQYTAIQDLTLNDEQIFKCFTKTYQNEIRRCENTLCHYIELSNDENCSYVLECFKKTYNKMFSDKGMKNVFNSSYINNLLGMNKLVISYVTIKGKPSIFHAYIIDNNISELMYSASDLAQDKEIRNEIGRNNKKLHYEDMLYLKNKGIEYLDWGGIGDMEGNGGIAKFKLGFSSNGGSIKKSYYHGSCSNSIFGSIVLSLIKLRGD